MPSLYLFLIPILVTVCSGNEDNEEYGKNLRRLQEDDLANQCMGQNNRRTLKCLRFTKIEERDVSSWPGFPLSATQYNKKRGNLSGLKNMGAASFINNLEDVAPNPYKYDDSTFQAIVSEPTHPTCNPKSEFWKEFKEVYDLQKRRVENGNQMKACNVMPVPSLWKDKTLDEAAEEVHDEYPGSIQANLISELMSKKKPYGEVIFDDSIVPAYSGKRFVRGIVMMAFINNWAVKTVSDFSFALKWKYGRARPEETFYRLIQDSSLESDKDCKQNIINEIGLDETFGVEIFPIGSFEDAINEEKKFTAYPEGCPNHPSWPAMHSAASSLALWLAVVLDSSTPNYKQIIEEAMRTDYAVSYSRTIAGVHYPSDNIDGLKLGQFIVRNQLPDLLASMDGNADSIKKKIDDAMTLVDWGTFIAQNIKDNGHYCDDENIFSK